MHYRKEIEVARDPTEAFAYLADVPCGRLVKPMRDDARAG
jgi:hypothetical protein